MKLFVVSDPPDRATVQRRGGAVLCGGGQTVGSRTRPLDAPATRSAWTTWRGRHGSPDQVDCDEIRGQRQESRAAGEARKIYSPNLLKRNVPVR